MHLKNLIHIPALAVMILMISMIAGCHKDPSKPPVDNSVSITSFSPLQGAEGTVVTIKGKNFHASASSNIVKINGTAAEVTAVNSSATELTVKVPTGATTGKITIATNNQTATSADNFTVLPSTAPSITSFSPGSEMEGAIVTITGKNFDADKTKDVVKFNGLTAEIISATATELKVRVPQQNTTTNATGKISITTGGQTTSSVTDFTLTPTSFTAEKLNAFIPCRVQFSNSVDGTSFKWRNETKGKDLSSDKAPEITFMEEGNFVISLTITRADGQQVFKTLSLTIAKDAGLVAYYPMGSYKDSSGNGNDAPLPATPLTQAPGRNGILNSAYYFSGDVFSSSGTEFKMPDNLIAGTGTATTVSFWFKAKVDGADPKPGVLLGYRNSSGGTTPEHYTPVVYIGTDGLLYSKFWYGTSPMNDANGVYKNQDWNHLVITGDGSGQAMYLNGVLVGSSGDAIDHMDMTTNSFGMGYSGGVWPYIPVNNDFSFFKGYIDDARIYKRRLTASEIQDLFHDKL